MPYAEPTSPRPVPLKPQNPEPSSRRIPHDSSTDTMSFRSVSNPLPSIPRRSSSSSTPATTGPLSPTTPRTSITSAVAGALASMRSVDSLPRRTPLSPSRPVGSLGLHLFGQATPPTTRGPPSTRGRSASSDASAPPAADKAAPLSPPTFNPNSPPSRPTPKPSLMRSKTTRERGLSASSLPSPSSPPLAATRPTTHMVRKKSGELVKSSLKQRSMSTPDLGRGLESSGDDGLRERTKSVRFDDLGLESVVLFLREQKPTAVSKAVEPNANDTPTETEEDNDTDLSDFVHFRTRRNGGSRSDSSKEIQIHAECTVPRVRLDFGPGTQGLLQGEYVVLERVEMQNGSPLAMRGTVLVRNVAFQKWVAIRFTLDHWQTTSEVMCQHVSHIPAGTTGDEGWDRFSFTIRLEDYKRKIEERLLHLCVRFSVDGHEWWDSNKGENYRFNFKRASIRKARSAPTPLRGGGVDSSSAQLPLRVPRSADKSPRSWLFPRLAPPPVERTDSPQQSPPPAAAFKPPSTPDVHAHLQLKRYCAPSPPKSPPKLPTGPGLILELAPVRERATAPSVSASETQASPSSPTIPMTLVHGRPATSWPPAQPAHDRSQSWNGNPGEVWQQTDKVSVSDSDEGNGDATPRAARARSPEVKTPTADPIDKVVTSPGSITPNTSEDELDKNKDKLHTLSHHRSTSDLRALAAQDSLGLGLATPPSSNLSSPPTPSTILPGPMSPSVSMSTGDSSPVNTNTGSPHDGEQLEPRGRTLNAATYQEFLDKFCFFKSPPSVTTPLEDPYATHTGFSLSGYSSPSIYGYFGNGSPQAVTPTARTYGQQTDSAATTPAAAPATSTASASTPRGSPPSRSPAGSYAPLPWTPNDPNPPSLAAA